MTAGITSLKLTRREELGKVAQLVRQRGVGVVNASVRSLIMETLCGEWLQAVFMVQELESVKNELLTVGSVIKVFKNLWENKCLYIKLPIIMIEWQDISKIYTAQSTKVFGQVYVTMSLH